MRRNGCLSSCHPVILSSCQVSGSCASMPRRSGKLGLHVRSFSEKVRNRHNWDHTLRLWDFCVAYRRQRVSDMDHLEEEDG
jgi:hypothetical protein